MRLSGTKTGAVNQYRGLGNQLWDLAGNRPSLDLRFADSKSLVDATTGTNLIDFTRASSGTYVGSDGLIKTATTNLLIRSEEFDNGSAWSTVNVSAFGSGSQANIETSPKGTLSADLVAVASGATSGNGFIYQDVTKPASSITYTATIYAKQQDWDSLTFIVHEATSFGNRAVVQVSLTNGSVSLVAALGTFSNASAAPAQLVGNGWYRVNLKFTSGTETVLRYRAYPQNSTSATSNGTNGIYVWGAQLEQSSTVGEYIPTTSTINSAPRFDHDPTTGECLGLLVEEQRSNLLLNSGTLSTQSVTVTAVDHTLSFTGTGTITLSGASTAGPLVGTGTGEANRVSLTFTPTAGSLTLTVSGTVTNAQLEIGAFRSSYIPTTTSAVTRAADVASISGSNFSSWYRQDEGTVFVDSYRLTLSSDPIRIFEFKDVSGDRYELISDVAIRSRTTIGGVITNIAPYTQGKGGAYAASYKAGNYAGAYKGGNPLVVTSVASVISASDVALGSSGSNLFINGHLRRFTFWPQRLPNSTLQNITQ